MGKNTGKGLPKPKGTVARTRKTAQKKAVASKKVRARTGAAKKPVGAGERIRAAAQKRAAAKRAVRKRTTQAHSVSTAVDETRLAAERKAAARNLTHSRTTGAAGENAADRALQELARRIVDLTERNDDEGCLALYAENVESCEAGQRATYGVDAIREKYRGWRQMTMTSEFRPRTVLAACNTIVIEWEGRVTLAASGQIAQLDEVAIHEIENGKIVRERYYYNPTVLQG